MKQARLLTAESAVKNFTRVRRNVLIVDLNNFSTFPTLAVGLIVASLRNAGMGVQLISPLAHGVPATERERAEGYLDHVKRRIHLSTHGGFEPLRNVARSVRQWWIEVPHPTILSDVRAALAQRPDVLMLSAYMQHHRTVTEIGKLAHAAGVPLLVGGPMFNLDETLDIWRDVPGLTAIVGAEADVIAPQLVEAASLGEDLLEFPGVTLADGRRSPAAPPLRPLDLTPVPDFTDFPWDRYRVHIVPIMASRGCQWNRCNFCSDIVSVSGRTFRSRSIDHVLHEMREQSWRHGTKNFIFLDLKINSNPSLFRGIIENIQSQLRGAQWIGTVHVDQRRDNGLTVRDLKAAAASGMRRVSFGLETGSQRLLDAMDKGCSVEGNAEFIRRAYEAGISVRSTMFKGYPGETVEDLNLTADFLDRHGPYIDRIRFNEFSLSAGTPIYAAVAEDPVSHPGWSVLGPDQGGARARYVNVEGRSRGYRKAKARVLRAVHAINRRPVRSSAREFDGLM